MTNIFISKKNLTAAALASASALAILTTGTAHAQSADTGFYDEIIVTARKTEESLQDVSLSISAFTADDIKKRSLTELENVALQTPGLSFEDFSNGGFGAPVIRGTSQIRVSLLEQNVSVFYDGIYIPRAFAFDSGTANIERIEVVKGPQSALYGANSFSGAINYVTPERDLTQTNGSITGGLGIDGLFEARGNISIPIVEDVLAISVAGSHTEFDGDFDNNFPGAENAPRQGTDEDIGGWDRDSLTAGITYNQNGLTVKGDYTRFEALNEVRAGYTISGTAQTQAGNPFGVVGSELNCGILSFGNPVGFCGELPTQLEPGVSGIEGLTVEPRSFLESETEIFRGEVNYEFTDNIDVTYLYGNVSSDIFAIGSSDRDPVAGSTAFLPFPPPGGFVSGNSFTVAPEGGVDYETHEVRLNYETDNGLSVLVGGYLLNGEDTDQFAAGFGPVGSLTPITDSDAFGLSLLTVTDTDINAIFGRISAPLTDTITLSAEARYSETDKTTNGQESSDTSFTPRINLDWQVTDDNLLYASFAQGVKAGGVNVSTVALEESEETFDEDKNTTYEIGTKNVFAGGRGTLNAAAYLIDWEDLQIGVVPLAGTFGTGGIIQNLGSATSKGIEVDGTFYLTENISVNGGVSLIDATYDDGTSSSRAQFLCDDVVCNIDGDISGNDLARVPEFQWNFGAQYDGEVGDDFSYFLRGDVAGQSSQQVSELNTASIESRALVNGRAGISKGPISLDIWVTNLFDKEYVSNSFFILNAFQTQYTATLGNARRAGVELTYDF